MPIRLQDKWSFTLEQEDDRVFPPLDPTMSARERDYIVGPPNARFVLTILCDGVEVFVMRTKSVGHEALLEFKYLVDEQHPLVALMNDANKGARHGG